MHYFAYLKFTHILHRMYFIFQNINRNQKISAMNGKRFFLVDVMAHIFHHLKCQLLVEHQDDYKASDFKWVITVPAIWKSEGKKLMREAGYLVSPTMILKNSR